MIRQPLQTIRSSAQATITASGSDAFDLPFFDFDTLVAKLVCSAASGTTPTLDVYLQTSDDGGTTFYDVAHMAQVTGTVSNAAALWATAAVNGGDGAYVGNASDASISAGAVSGLPILGRRFRIKWVVAGTSPSFTFTVTLYANNQSPAH